MRRSPKAPRKQTKTRENQRRKPKLARVEVPGKYRLLDAKTYTTEPHPEL